MISLRFFPFVIALFACTFFRCEHVRDAQQPIGYHLSDEEASSRAVAIRQEVSAEVDSLLELSLWASDSLLKNPVALDIDHLGRAYVTRSNRRRTSEFDIRRHREWETASISFQTVEDRRAFLREKFPIGNEKTLEKPIDFNKDGVHDWRDLTVQSEEVHRIEDRSGDGIADYAQLFASEFNTEITDVAGGVMAFDEDVFLAVAPDLWRLQDLNGDGVVDERTSISHGFQVHIGFGGHNMSGVIMGPDGRVYWGIGDIGFNGTDQDGQRWAYPNQGVIARCNPDGSDFEIFAAGLRNTHEFVFDAYGNLISVDNDGDHPGESERLVYITNGSDSGWRINWQFGKYRDPRNNTYKVWMDEGLNLPRFEGQAAYITPCIRNFTNGPTGMVYNPGAALNRSFANHFFVVEFNGNPARSGIHTFTLKQKGASFDYESGRKILSGVLATGLDIGPDGALYCTDWIDGWEGMERGRIWKLDAKENDLEQLRKETQELLEGSFSDASMDDLAEWLGHSDMRVRMRAQFALAKRGEEGLQILKGASREKANQLRRIHGIWGMAQIARQQSDVAKELVPFLNDHDAEIRAQTAKMIGDVKYQAAASALVPLLKDPSDRVRFFAAEALGRTQYKDAFDAIVQMLDDNDDADAHLRHAGALALSRLNAEEEIAALSTHPNLSVRIAAVVALRRMQSPLIEKFLSDESEYLVTEVARAINDDWSIPEALPALGAILAKRNWSSEALIRRALNANLRVGSSSAMQKVVDFAQDEKTAIEMREEALAILGVWSDPSPLDRVDGRYRGEITRTSDEVISVAGSTLRHLLNSHSPKIRIASLRAIQELKIIDAADAILKMVRNDRDSDVRAQALLSLSELNSPDLEKGVQQAFKDKNSKVRVEAVKALESMDLAPKNKIDLLQGILREGVTLEKQAAIAALSKIDLIHTKSTIAQLLGELVAGRIDPLLQLDLIELANQNEDPDLQSILKQFRDQHVAKGVMGEYVECLEGGDEKKGQNILTRNSAAQCLKCHAIRGYGGVAGPALDELGLRMSKEKILESLIDPSKEIAPGYGVATLTLEDETLISGIIKDESDTQIVITDSEGVDIPVAKSNIKERLNAASSMTDMKSILTKYEIRDLVAFLSALKGQELVQ